MRENPNLNRVNQLNQSNELDYRIRHIELLKERNRLLKKLSEANTIIEDLKKQIDENGLIKRVELLEICVEKLTSIIEINTRDIRKLEKPKQKSLIKTESGWFL